MQQRNDTAWLHLPALDGLRLFAFLAVFIHHMPEFVGIPGMATLRTHGWVGVEMFFTVSAFLFFYLLDAERKKTGAIDVAKFYGRRLLRILPLMWFYAIGSLLIFGTKDPSAYVRLPAILLGLDNLATWLDGYNSSMQSVAHLWTLSFELQVYIVVPVAFLALQKLGLHRFSLLILGIAAYATAARIVAAMLGAGPVSIWVSPFLRPEAILLGMAVALRPPNWRPGISLFIAVAAAIALVLLPSLGTKEGSMIVYPFSALFSAAVLDLALRANWLRPLLLWRPIRWLGTISYGLYVFHMVSIWLAGQVLLNAGMKAGSRWLYVAQFTSAMAMTVALAAASYYLLERPFLRLKDKISPVLGRAAVATHSQQSQHPLQPNAPLTAEKS